MVRSPPRLTVAPQSQLSQSPFYSVGCPILFSERLSLQLDRRGDELLRGEMQAMSVSLFGDRVRGRIGNLCLSPSSSC